MGYRWTDNEKWDDKWFRNLSPNAKTLFSFLCDKCNRAGVYEIDKPYMMFTIGLNKDELSSAIGEIGKAYVKSNNGNYIYLINFLKNQRKLPLNTLNNEHRPIIAMLQKYISNKDLFEGCEAMLYVIPDQPTDSKDTEPNKKKKKVSSSRFVKPNIDEIRTEMLGKGLDKKDEAEKFFEHYETNGWKVGRNPMKNWKMAVSKWVRSHKDAVPFSTNKSNFKKESKLENIKKSHESTSQASIDYNEIHRAKHGE